MLHTVTEKIHCQTWQCEFKCDNGTNFVSGENELKHAFTMMDDNEIEFFLANLETDWMTLSKDAPAASHMSGVWERQIQSCRNILSSILKNLGTSLNYVSLRTLATEVDVIVSSKNSVIQPARCLYLQQPSDFENESNHASTW